MHPSRRQFLTTMATGALTLISSAESTARPNAIQPNIVFLFSDDHSVPDLGCYGNTAIRTPVLDALAATGMRFDRGYVTSPQCSPSRASILTGRTPHAAGASRLHMNAPKQTPNVPTLLRNAGYHTGALRKVHQGHIQRDFDYYGGYKKPTAAFFEQRPKDKPFFLWFGSTDPHRDYGPGALDPPHDPAKVLVPDFLADTPETRQDLAYYYDEIGRFDKECGELIALLEQQGVRDNTLIVMAGDNGMPFPRAKATLYEAGVKVPLIVNWPGVIKPGQTTKALASLMDLAKTWLDVAGAEIPGTMEGVSLRPLLTGEKDTVRSQLFTERNWHDNWDPMRSVVTERYKLIQNYRPEVGYIPSWDLLRSPSFNAIESKAKAGTLEGLLTWYQKTTKPLVELYDLENDPGEWNNLAADPAYAQRVIDMQKALGKWMNQTNDFLPPPAAHYGKGRINTLDGQAIWWD